MASTAVKVTIPSGVGGVSGEVDFTQYRSLVVHFPAGWVTTDLVVQASDDVVAGGDYKDIADEGSAPLKIGTAVGGTVRSAPQGIRDAAWFKLKSVSDQGGDKQLTLILKG